MEMYKTDGNGEILRFRIYLYYIQKIGHHQGHLGPVEIIRPYPYHEYESLFRIVTPYDYRPPEIQRPSEPDGTGGRHGAIQDV